MTRPPSKLALAAAVALCALAIPGGAGAQDGVDRLAGTWKNVAGDGGKATIVRAIEKGVEPMGFLRERIARGKLIDNNPPIPQLVIRKRGNDVEVVFDGTHVYTAPLGGSFQKNKSPEGDTVKVSHRLRGSTLVQTVETGGGGSTMMFKTDADGDRLAVTMIIRSRHLPGPIRYTLRFRKG